MGKQHTITNNELQRGDSQGPIMDRTLSKQKSNSEQYDDQQTITEQPVLQKTSYPQANDRFTQMLLSKQHSLQRRQQQQQQVPLQQLTEQSFNSSLQNNGLQNPLYSDDSLKSNKQGSNQVDKFTKFLLEKKAQLQLQPPQKQASQALSSQHQNSYSRQISQDLQKQIQQQLQQQHSNNLGSQNMNRANTYEIEAQQLLQQQAGGESKQESFPSYLNANPSFDLQSESFQQNNESSQQQPNVQGQNPLYNQFRNMLQLGQLPQQQQTQLQQQQQLNNNKQADIGYYYKPQFQQQQQNNKNFDVAQYYKPIVQQPNSKQVEVGKSSFEGVSINSNNTQQQTSKTLQQQVEPEFKGVTSLDQKNLDNSQYNVVPEGLFYDSQQMNTKNRKLGPKALSKIHENSSTQETIQQLSRQDSKSSVFDRNQLKGIDNMAEQTFLVQEFCRLGSLKDFRILGNLYNPSTQKSSSNVRVPQRQIPNISLITGIALDIVRGMVYLSSQHVVHGDLKPENVLLQPKANDIKGFHTKLSDFGRSILLNQDDKQAMGNVYNLGTVNYTAPEVLLEGKISFKSDVYSFGMVLWEMLENKIPFADCSPVEILRKVALSNQRPKLNTRISLGLRILVEMCWDQDPNKRPSFTRIYKYLNLYYAKILDKQKIQKAKNGK